MQGGGAVPGAFDGRSSSALQDSRPPGAGSTFDPSQQQQHLHQQHHHGNAPMLPGYGASSSMGGSGAPQPVTSGAAGHDSTSQHPSMRYPGMSGPHSGASLADDSSAFDPSANKRPRLAPDPTTFPSGGSLQGGGGGADGLYMFTRPGQAAGGGMLGMRQPTGPMAGPSHNQSLPARMGSHMVSSSQHNIAHQTAQMSVAQHNQSLQHMMYQPGGGQGGQGGQGGPGGPGGAQAQPTLQQQLHQQQQQLKMSYAQMLGQAQPGMAPPGRLEGLHNRMGPGLGGGMGMGGMGMGMGGYGAAGMGGMGGGGFGSGMMRPGMNPSQFGNSPAMLQMLMAQRQRQQEMQAAQAAAAAAAQAAAEPEEDPEADILAKVGKISDTLRSMLGKSVTDKGYSGTDEDASAVAANPSIVKRENLVEACGPIAQQLKSYQLVGINFLMMLHKSESVGGAILADEMGLGKTAQTISFLGVLRTLIGNRSPHLVVCPASLIQNWARELKQWCPSMRVLVYHGKDRDQARGALQRWRRKVRAAHKEGRIAELPPGVLLLEDEDAREDAREEAAARLNEEEDAPDYGEGDGGYGEEEWDDSKPVCGLTIPSETSGEAAFDIMLTTYTLFEREGGYKADRAFLLKWKWCYMVADEAHALKNRSSVRTRKLRKVAAACESRILLTGTPLQNSLEELRALLEFLMPSLFIDPNNPDADEIKDDETHMRKLDEEEQHARVERYKQLLAPFILRRLKSEVATQLQTKKQVVQEVEMTPSQADMYRAAVENMRREVAAAARSAELAKAAATAVTSRTRKGGAKDDRRGAAAAAAGLGARSGGGGSSGGGAPNADQLLASLGSQRVNNIFTHLRKVAQHPLLIRNLYTEQQIQQMAELASQHSLFGGNCSYDRVFKELVGYSDHQLHTFSSSWPTYLSQFMLDPSALMTSAKVVCLDELLPKFFAEGNKVLLFSQWTMTLDLLEWYMQLKGFSYVRLDGNTVVEERLSLVDKFNDPGQGIFCFLLSTRAGGQGLNLTGADIVVLHDVDFNPQVDRQAEDRCHRLGQTKPVTVYRLVTKNTVDQNVLAIAERKLALDAAVLNDVTIGAGEDGDGGEAGDGEGGEGKPKSRRGRPKLENTETRAMGAILSQLLSEEVVG